MNAKYHCKSKTKINSDRRKNVKSDNNCSVIEGTLSGYFVLKAQDTLDCLSSSEFSRAPFIIKVSTFSRRP